MREGRRADGVHLAQALPALSGASVTVRDGSDGDIDAMAQLWAGSTAARDGDPDVAGLELSRPLISEVMAGEGTAAVVAVEADRMVAFALGGREGEAFRVRFVAAAPDRWGERLGARVLEELSAKARALGYRLARLRVYADNPPAIRAYERLGWVREDVPAEPHERTGRLEVRYVLELAG